MRGCASLAPLGAATQGLNEKATGPFRIVYEPPAIAAPLNGLGMAFDLVDFNPLTPLNFEVELEEISVSSTLAPELPETCEEIIIIPE